MYDYYTDIAGIAQLQGCISKRTGMWATVVINMRACSKLNVQFRHFTAVIHRLQLISAQTGVFITTMGSLLWTIHVNIETLRYQLLHSASWYFCVTAIIGTLPEVVSTRKYGAGLNLRYTLLRESLSTFLCCRGMKSDITCICGTGIT
jgi:hypothetical protein